MIFSQITDNFKFLAKSYYYSNTDAGIENFTKNYKNNLLNIKKYCTITELLIHNDFHCNILFKKVHNWEIFKKNRPNCWLQLKKNM